ncbi:MAG: hypothetical protein QUV05_18215 [Phycisphaerae bacterium]|jgi:hypothetical protein|nr:hypothetical protein [Phycisphaerae bacterium]
MNPLPVSAGRLARSTIRFQDATLTNCVLLPLFDGRGVTARVIVLSADTRECRVFDWRPDLVYVPLPGAARVDMLWATPQRAAAGKQLWFYDRGARTAPSIGHLCGELGHGNCAGWLPRNIVSVFWRRDLSRVSLVLWREKGGLQFGRWKADWLPAAPPKRIEETPVHPARGWVLDPVWAR